MRQKRFPCKWYRLCVKTYADHAAAKYFPSNRTTDDAHYAIFLDIEFLSLNSGTKVKGEQNVMR